MQLTCDHASGLVPSYLDGELSEAQAAPLRAHLLGCPVCRERAKEGKALKRWFVAEHAQAVPEGFAARVARRAFAGDPGAGEPAEVAARALAADDARVLPFVMRLTAVAAALLIALAGLMQLQSRPTSADELRADDIDQVWQEIYGSTVGAERALPVRRVEAEPRLDAEGEPAAAR